MNHSTEAIHHSCAMNHVIQFQSHRTWISTLEIQSQPFIFSRPGGIGYIFLKGQKQYFRRGNHTSPSQLLDSATIAQRQPQTIQKQMGVTLSQQNWIYGHWHLNFICWWVTKISFWFYFNHLKD